MAPESERANCPKCLKPKLHDGMLIPTAHAQEWRKHYCCCPIVLIIGGGKVENIHMEPEFPNEPTLTCSEVVERLAECARMSGDFRHIVWDRAEATAILHSWRERRVQELEEALRLAKVRIGILIDRMRGCDEMNGQKHEVSIPEGEAWMKDIKELLGSGFSKHSLMPEPLSTQLDTGTEKR